MSPAAKRGPPTSEPSTLNLRCTPASHRPADWGLSWVQVSVFGHAANGHPSNAPREPRIRHPNGGSMNVYFDTVQQQIRMLENLDRWIEMAVEYAKTKNFDPNVLVQARLAPDQY